MLSSVDANLRFTKAFETVVTLTQEWLNNSPWYDALLFTSSIAISYRLL